MIRVFWKAVIVVAEILLSHYKRKHQKTEQKLKKCNSALVQKKVKLMNKAMRLASFVRRHST